MNDEYVTSIPQDATKREVEVDEQGLCRRAEYLVDGKVVGVRCFDEHGHRELEWGCKDGKKHGIEYRWHEPGVLISAEPWSHGIPDGVAKQWSHEGDQLGTFTLINGTGLDVWRAKRPDGSVYAAEVHTMVDGKTHGFEWWINEDQKTVNIERHWHRGQEHGIERHWDNDGNLFSEYPQFNVNGETTTLEVYLEAARSDQTLPPFREEDNAPNRIFPPDVRTILG